jgi:hypothetical protein
MMLNTLKHRKGQALVETALVLGIIVLFTFAITEFGRAMYIKNMLNNAARSGVRQAIVTSPLDSLPRPYSYSDGSYVDSIQEKICQGIMYLDSTQKSAVEIKVWIPNPADPDNPNSSLKTSASNGDVIKVRVRAPFTPFVKLNIANILDGQASMRYE